MAIVVELQVGFTSSAAYKCLEDLNRDYVDLYLSYCRTEHCRSGDSFEPFIRTEYMIHIVTEKTKFYQVGNETYSLETN